MNTISTLEEAVQLLAEIKQRIRSGGILFMNRRGKNAQALSDLGILPVMQREIIDSLEPQDYCGGPEPDEKYPWKLVAVFGKEFNDAHMYIKFSFGEPGTPVVCLSFHEAARPMKYAFK